jgi:hypothetical protein
MHKSTSNIVQPGADQDNKLLVTRGESKNSHEVAPESPHQLQKINSDVGEPVLVHCSEGSVYAFDLSQTDDAYKPIPSLLNPVMKLPNRLKYFQYQELFSLGNIGSAYKETPNLNSVCAKAFQLMRVFQYHRVNKVIARLDVRPFMGYAQTVRVSSTTSADTTTSSRHRKGVTYNLADNPTMYFIIPFSDRDYAKLSTEPWFTIIVDPMTDPITTTSNPAPLQARLSYEILDMDFYVERNARLLSTSGTGAIPVIPVGINPNGIRSVVTVRDPCYVVMQGMQATLVGNISSGGNFTISINNDIIGTLVITPPSLIARRPLVFFG